MEKIKKANKNYQCNNCYRDIKKGSQYKVDVFRLKSSYDSEFDIYLKSTIITWRTHINCRLQNLS